MAAVVTVLYPDVEDATFDMDYYLARHMPLVAQRFGAHGLTGWRVQRIRSAPGRHAPYSVVATLEFGSAEGFEAAVAAEGPAIFGDVPNFSNKAPELIIGDVVGHG